MKRMVFISVFVMLIVMHSINASDPTRVLLSKNALNSNCPPQCIKVMPCSESPVCISYDISNPSCASCLNGEDDTMRIIREAEKKCIDAQAGCDGSDLTSLLDPRYKCVARCIESEVTKYCEQLQICPAARLMMRIYFEAQNLYYQAATAGGSCPEGDTVCLTQKTTDPDCFWPGLMYERSGNKNNVGNTCRYLIDLRDSTQTCTDGGYVISPGTKCFAEKPIKCQKQITGIWTCSNEESGFNLNCEHCGVHNAGIAPEGYPCSNGQETGVCKLQSQAQNMQIDQNAPNSEPDRYCKSAVHNMAGYAGCSDGLVCCKETFAGSAVLQDNIAQQGATCDTGPEKKGNCKEDVCVADDGKNCCGDQNPGQCDCNCPGGTTKIDAGTLCVCSKPCSVENVLQQGSGCCAGTKKCNDNVCRSYCCGDANEKIDADGCCNGLNQCKDGNCREVCCNGEDQNAGVDGCCEGLTQCSDGKCKASCCGGNEQRAGPDGCCGDLKKCSDGRCYTNCDDIDDCPLLYSVTKEGVKFEEPLIELQLGKAMDRNFYSKLNRFDPAVGQIMIDEPFKEDAYINHVKLLSASHPSDRVAMISGDGTVVTVREELPVICTDKNGLSCTNKVNRRDAEYIEPLLPIPGEVVSPASFGRTAYSTDMERVNLDIPETYKDHIEITLPATKRYVKLIVLYSLTPKMSTVEQGLAEEFRDILPWIYGSLDSELIGNKVSERLIEAAFARVMVQDDAGVWRDYSGDMNSNFLSYTKKETVVILDRSRIKDRKIRIEFTSGAYAIDYVGVDDSEDSVDVQEIPLNYADKNGLDVKGLLSLKDDTYANLSISENITIGFDAKEESTYFLESSGYYHPGAVRDKKFDAVQTIKIVGLVLLDDVAERYILRKLMD